MFEKTKNLNFAYAIDLALTEFAKMDLGGEFKRYSLKQVFDKGEIETLVIAKPKDQLSGSSHVNNILTEAINHRGDFTSTIEGIRNASYNINLNGLLKLTPIPKKEEKQKATAFGIDILNSISTIRANPLFSTDLNETFPQGINSEEDVIKLVDFLKSKSETDYPIIKRSLNINVNTTMSQRLTNQDDVFDIESKTLDDMIKEILPEGEYDVTDINPSTKQWTARYRLISPDSVTVYEVTAKLNDSGVVNISHKLLSNMGGEIEINDITNKELENFDAKAESLLPGWKDDKVLNSVVGKVREIYETAINIVTLTNSGDPNISELNDKVSKLVNDFTMLITDNIEYLDIDNDFGDKIEVLFAEISEYKNRSCE